MRVCDRGLQQKKNFPRRCTIRLFKSIAKHQGGKLNANIRDSLSHTKWLCKYHIVFTPKSHRKKTLRKCNFQKSEQRQLRTNPCDKFFQFFRVENCFILVGYLQVLVPFLKKDQYILQQFQAEYFFVSNFSQFQFLFVQHPW